MFGPRKLAWNKWRVQIGAATSRYVTTAENEWALFMQADDLGVFSW
jgi:hypothetical protein